MSRKLSNTPNAVTALRALVRDVAVRISEFNNPAGVAETPRLQPHMTLAVAKEVIAIPRDKNSAPILDAVIKREWPATFADAVARVEAYFVESEKYNSERKLRRTKPTTPPAEENKKPKVTKDGPRTKPLTADPKTAESEGKADGVMAHHALSNTPNAVSDLRKMVRDYAVRITNVRDSTLVAESWRLQPHMTLAIAYEVVAIPRDADGVPVLNALIEREWPETYADAVARRDAFNKEREARKGPRTKPPSPVVATADAAAAAAADDDSATPGSKRKASYTETIGERAKRQRTDAETVAAAQAAAARVVAAQAAAAATGVPTLVVVPPPPLPPSSPPSCNGIPASASAAAAAAAAVPSPAAANGALVVPEMTVPVYSPAPAVAAATVAAAASAAAAVDPAVVATTAVATMTITTTAAPEPVPVKAKAPNPALINEWNEEDVQKWLYSIAPFAKYADGFKDLVDGSMLLQLTDEHLKKYMGVEHELHLLRMRNDIAKFKKAAAAAATARA